MRTSFPRTPHGQNHPTFETAKEAEQQGEK